MRVNGYTDMEYTGESCFILIEGVKPLTLKDVHLQPTPTYIPIPVNMDPEIQISIKVNRIATIQLTSYIIEIKELDKAGGLI
ncbi:hypothetical protein [Peribacillus simplex]|uniref:Uncharacterized protein n=1 Tax=Peribacillus simplex TaxID=1478 RepID=A0AAW7IEW2_9BACI|nr:hypothetical protein [Peribacillus simplex]MDM5453631.1 hypothetical protein [Peribacillus simplex]